MCGCMKSCGRVEGYYETLAAAVTAVNLGSIDVTRVKSEDDKVRVWADSTGRIGIVLLDDVAENEALEIGADVELELNGKTISFTGEGFLHFGSGTDCVIYGQTQGSCVCRSVGAEASTAHLIQADGEQLRLLGGQYVIEGAHAEPLRGVRAMEGCGILEIVGCTVSAVNGEEETDAKTRTVQSQATKTVVQSSVLISRAGDEAQGVIAQGETEIEKTEVDVLSRSGMARAVRAISGNMSIRACEIGAVTTAATVVGVHNAEACVRVEDSQVTATSGSSYVAAFWNNEGELQIEGGSAAAVSESGETKTVVNFTGTVTINGGSLTSSTESVKAYVVYNDGGSCVIVDSHLDASSESADSCAVQVAGGTVSVDGADIHAITYGQTSGMATGIGVNGQCILYAKDSRVLADARGDSAVDGPLSIAFVNSGTAYLDNVEMNGTHSGIQNGGAAKLYINGGVYTGFCHGGIYFCQGPEGEAFVNDATLRAGCYEGVFDYSELQDDKFSAVYIGGGPDSVNITAYMDGCRIDGTDGNTSIVVRGTSGEQNNTLNVSNCTLVDPSKWIRVDNDTLRINIGVGTNITTASLKYVEKDGSPVDYVEKGRAAFTGALYRRNHVDHVCDGRDYDALKKYVEACLTDQ